jgi:hypothetical protein
MVNYQEGKIYKLVGGGLTYYGSTCNELRIRFYQHKQKHNICKSNKLFDTGDKVEIILVEKYPCNDKMELHQRERYYIENNNCINKYIPLRTAKEYKKQYKENNKDKYKEGYKNYYINNKQKFKDYEEKNKDKIKKIKGEKIKCDCGSVIRKGEISRHNKTKKHITYLNENKYI